MRAHGVRVAAGDLIMLDSDLGVDIGTRITLEWPGALDCPRH